MSPDVIGINSGAALGALIVLTVIGGSGATLVVGALIGAVLTATAILLIAYKRGLHGFRLVLARHLRLLELGDDPSRALSGTRHGHKITLVLVAVALAALATAAAGPIGFVALVAPQITRRLLADLPAGQITAIIGPNGCGKSTLLRGLAGLLSPRAGRALLGGQDVATLPARQLATRLGLLPQQPIAPDGITVADLVGRGRHPHQRWFRRWSAADEDAVTSAMASTGVAEMADTPIDELSGGQRQRVWIALALAQDPEIMLPDEPTTYLDLAHQLDVLDLLTSTNRRLDRTIVIVLHDLNAQGPPEEIVTTEMVREVFGVEAAVITDPVAGSPLVLPHSVHQPHRNQPRGR